MGEVAEMMMDGTLCQRCGTVNDSLANAPDLMENGEIVMIQGDPMKDWSPPGNPWTCKRCLGVSDREVGTEEFASLEAATKRLEALGKELVGRMRK